MLSVFTQFPDNSGPVELILAAPFQRHLFEMASCYLPIPCDRYLLVTTCSLVRASGLTELGSGLLLTYHALCLCVLVMKELVSKQN